MHTTKSNLTELVVAKIQQMVLASGLEPGQPFMYEKDLEQKLNVSRQILREALSRLRALGILESRKRVGLIIAKPDPINLFGLAIDSLLYDSMDLKELGELRFSLEIGAVELSARRATPTQVHDLFMLADEFCRHSSRSDGDRCIDDIEIDFHRTILEASGNQMIYRMHHILALFFVRSNQENPHVSGTMSNATRGLEHKMIAEALSRRDAIQARILLARHLSPLISEQEHIDKA